MCRRRFRGLNCVFVALLGGWLWATSTGPVVAGDTNAQPVYDGRPVIVRQQAGNQLDLIVSALNQQLKAEPTNTAVLYSLAMVYRATGDFKKSLPLWDRYMVLVPTNELAYVARASIYNSTGKYDHAIKDLDMALQLNPYDVRALSDRAYSFSSKGDFGRAEQDLTEACRQDPNNETALNNRAWIHATCPVASHRNGAAAVSEATRACILSDWKRSSRVDTLAAAYAESGDFVRAVIYEKTAMETRDATGDDLKGMRDRLKLYESHHAYRERSGE
jgi:tetratricopeptide (TPR) repeat protein